MLDIFAGLFDTTGFPARWNCGDWSNELGWLHIYSDLAIWAAYTAIPCVLAFFILRRKDAPFPRILWLFVAFIFACGTTHLISAIIFWQPVYRLDGVVKFLTAVVSWGTVVALVQITPKALHLPGLERINTQLAHEIAERKRSEELLRFEEERLRLALIAGRMGTWSWDIATNRVAWSAELESIHEDHALGNRHNFTFGQLARDLAHLLQTGNQVGCVAAGDAVRRAKNWLETVA